MPPQIRISRFYWLKHVTCQPCIAPYVVAVKNYTAIASVGIRKYLKNSNLMLLSKYLVREKKIKHIWKTRKEDRREHCL